MMKRSTVRLVAASLVAIGLGISLALWVWRPGMAPTATGSAEPAASSDTVPAVPAAGPWAQVTWEEPIVQPLGQADVLLRIDGLVGGDGLLLGWGRTPMPGRNQFNDMGAIFVSRDGADWRTVPVEHGVNAVSASTILDVVIGPQGILAVGSVCCEPEQGAVWRSADGQAWERIEVTGAVFEAGAQPYSTLALPNGWLMLVTMRDGTAVVYSEDGVAWETVLESDANEVNLGIQGIAHGPVGFLAVGTATGPDETYDGIVWSSDDGRAWDRVAIDDPALADDGEVYLHDVVGHTGGYLATGVVGTAEQRRTCEEMALVASLIDLPQPPREVTTSCVMGDEQLWTSADGLTWQRVGMAAGALRPIEFRVTAAGGPGLVVLGEGSGPESPDTMLFGSDDGIGWRVLSDADPMLSDTARGLAVRGDEIVAVTESWDGEQTTYRVWRGVAR